MVSNMSTEYVEKFGYRKYTGRTNSRLKRVFNLAWFEMSSTWRKSTFGKVLLIIILIINFFSLLALVTISPFLAESSELEKLEYVRRELSNIISYYLSIGNQSFKPEGLGFGFTISINIGFLLIPLLGIAGSGMFADDKQGHLVEIYLSKLRRSEYAMGKIGAIFLYNNIIITLPMILISFMYVQGFGEDHFKFLDLYVLIIIFGFISSLFLGMFILVLSIVVEKRSYASLSFFLLYFLGSIFGQLVYQLNRSNEYLLLIPSATFFVLLGFSIMGMWDLEQTEFFGIITDKLNLNDGQGLEFYHFWFTAIFLTIILSLFLYIRLRRLTTKEL
ncbi:MAG: hypothetical protein HeimC3_08080 [Candidatus Heimdallarchaeota archaeon LC_3]|nr:MAG: hypothetical protein HeimC3_08080 [Candidatus Heimdallarchaeota archaeon LC_3]